MINANHFVYMFCSRMNLGYQNIEQANFLIWFLLRRRLTYSASAHIMFAILLAMMMCESTKELQIEKMTSSDETLPR